MGLVSLEDFREVLTEAAESDLPYVLVGGLAVALWAENYGLFSEKMPLYSKDLDLRGLRIVAHNVGLLMKLRGSRVTLLTTVTRKEPAGMGKTHVLQVELPGAGKTNVEVIERLPLLDDPDLPVQGLAIAIRGIQVLDPVSLLICKAHAWNHRPQGEASNDAVHIEMLAGIVPQFAREARERGIDLAERWQALRRAHALCPLPLAETFWE